MTLLYYYCYYYDNCCYCEGWKWKNIPTVIREPSTNKLCNFCFNLMFVSENLVKFSSSPFKFKVFYGFCVWLLVELVCTPLIHSWRYLLFFCFNTMELTKIGSQYERALSVSVNVCLCVCERAREQEARALFSSTQGLWLFKISILKNNSVLNL